MSDLLRSPEDLVRRIEEYGFLPFFRNEILGFSVEEMTPPELWFSATEDGPWEWKGPAVRTRRCIYGKLFCRKAGYVSLEWAKDFLNYRRDGYDFDSGLDEGIYPLKDHFLYDEISANGPIQTDRLKRNAGYASKGKSGYDGTMTRLQMQTYIVVSDFVYRVDKTGKTFGWGVAEYSTPEKLFGTDWVSDSYLVEPEESFQRMLNHLQNLLPEADMKSLRKILSR